MNPASVISRLLEDEEDEVRDFIADIPAREPRITSVYEIRSGEDGDGFGELIEDPEIDDEGEDMTPDEFDVEDGITAVDKAVKYLYDQGATECSSSVYHDGDWFSTESQMDSMTGNYYQSSYFLKDFTPEEGLEIYKRLKHARRHGLPN